MQKLSQYEKSKYYSKYGDAFEELEAYAYEMGEEWDAYIKMYDELDIILHKYHLMLCKQRTDLKQTFIGCTSLKKIHIPPLVGYLPPSRT